MSSRLNRDNLAREPKGWPASLIMFHIARWRERLRSGLTDFDAGRPYTPPPANIDEFNDQELPSGRDLTLKETSARADAELEALTGLIAKVGDQPFNWNLARTTGDALVRNSYFHPRMHISEYWHENGGNDRAHDLIETTATDLREMPAASRIRSRTRMFVTESSGGIATLPSPVTLSPIDSTISWY